MAERLTMARGLPDKGVLIVDSRDQRKIQPALSDYAERAKDWEYSEQVKFLNRWAGIFKERLLDPVAVPGKPALPDPVIGFEKMRVETLAAYTLNRNNHGLLYEVNFNTKHELDSENGKQWRYGQWGMLETLLHEMIHLWQQNAGEHPYKKGNNTHNAEFVKKAESFGLHPMPVVGCHIAPADGVFAALMKEHGIERPQGEIPADSKDNWWSFFGDLFKAPPKGRSSLTKWACECDPPQLARIGKAEFFAECPKCRASFKRQS